MRLLACLFEPRVIAHCDIPCGVYDPAQVRIEDEYVQAICEKYAQTTNPAFRTRALLIKKQRSELVKHHLWVLWTDYFKAPHFEKYPQLHQLFNEATKLAEASGTPRAAPMPARLSSCSPRSAKSAGSSGKPSRPEPAKSEQSKDDHAGNAPLRRRGWPSRDQHRPGHHPDSCPVARTANRSGEPDAR